MDLGLGPTRRALELLGRPERDLAVVHLAGTNGKGSVGAMLESIAREAGLRTSLYTSPHLCRFAERIRIDRAPIDEESFRQALSATVETGVELTFFESLTVAAFVASRAAGVDLTIVETGLGGRLDATNVVEAPLATAITSIGLDHMSLLGSTIPAIAREKAGILKTGVPFVLGEMGADAEATILAVAAEVGAIVAPPEPAYAGAVGLAGPHQIGNATVASSVARALGGRWPRLGASIERGIASVRWPGRFERIFLGDREVTVILDAAHNPQGMTALVSTLVAERVDPERTIVVFGALADKAYAPMLELLAPRARHRVYTSPKGRAPAPFEALDQIARGEHVPEPRAAIARALEVAERGDTVVVAGSIYMLGEVRASLLGLECDPLVAL